MNDEAKQRFHERFEELFTSLDEGIQRIAENPPQQVRAAVRNNRTVRTELAYADWRKLSQAHDRLTEALHRLGLKNHRSGGITIDLDAPTTAEISVGATFTLTRDAALNVWTSHVRGVRGGAPPQYFYSGADLPSAYHMNFAQVLYLLEYLCQKYEALVARPVHSEHSA